MSQRKQEIRRRLEHAGIEMLAKAREDLSYLLDRVETLEEALRPLEALFLDEGDYAGSPAMKIERIVEKHGSKMLQEVVNQHFTDIRESLASVKKSGGDKDES